MATLPASWCQATKRKASLQNRGRGSAKVQRVMNVKECGIEAIDQIVTKHISDFRDKGGAVPVKDFDVDDFINTVPFFKCLADIRHDKESTPSSRVQKSQIYYKCSRGALDRAERDNSFTALPSFVTYTFGLVPSVTPRKVSCSPSHPAAGPKSLNDLT